MSKLSLRMRRAAAIHSVSAALFCLAGGGCTDHRIGLGEFLAMEQELGQVAPPALDAATQPATTQPTATQPAAAEAAIRSVINQQLGPYRAGPSDVLGISFAMVDQAVPPPPLQVRVNRSGELNLPLAGQIKVDGMELEDVEEAIRKAFVPSVYRNATVHVALVEPDTTNVLVIGAVTEPGLIKLRRTERNLLFAIVAAGGVSDIASGDVTLRRIRRATEEVTLKLTDPEELKAALTLHPLEDGDILTVHAAIPNVVFVGGLVNAPRPQEYPQGVNLTVLQALAGSGGLRTDVTPREATLIRRMPDGQDVHVKLDLDRVTTGRDPNIELAAGDILWVPDTIETRVQDWVNRNIFFRAGVSANVTYGVTGVEYLNRRSLQTGGGGGAPGLEGSFDPFGFLTRNTALQTIGTQTSASP